ncbi:MAG: AEC family transporter [bacterium]|nr:AEC family transporter [bacterium]
MTLFFELVTRVAPLYGFILLGFIVGRFSPLRKEFIARLLIYCITPLVVLEVVWRTSLTNGAWSLPFLFFILATVLCACGFFLAQRIWKDETKNILAFSAGAGNTGYFGLPVVSSLLGDDVLAFAILAVLGVILYENSVGYFITARGHFSVKKSLRKVLCLPALFAFVGGALLHTFAVPLPTLLHDAGFYVRGAYTVLGMMLIGFSIVGVRMSTIDLKFLSVTFFMKFLAWPFLAGGVIVADTAWFHIYSPEIHQVIFLLSIVPLAANTVVFATELNAKSEQMAFAVLSSTLFALLYIPFLVTLVHLV